jgi:hypothetical protein
MDVIRVVDVPVGATEDEAQSLMNVPCSENHYMLVQVLPLPGGASRAFYRLLGRAYTKPPKPVPELTGKEDEDAQALKFLKANLGKPSRVIAADFKKETGIVRSFKWFQRWQKMNGLEWPVKP